MPSLTNEEVVRRYADARARHGYDTRGELRIAISCGFDASAWWTESVERFDPPEWSHD